MHILLIIIIVILLFALFPMLVWLVVTPIALFMTAVVIGLIEYWPLTILGIALTFIAGVYAIKSTLRSNDHAESVSAENAINKYIDTYMPEAREDKHGSRK